MTGEFVEVMPPERLVFLASALDGDGKPMFVNRNIVTFTEVPGGTEIALDVRVVSMTAEAMKYLPGLTMGWSMSFDKLEEYLG
jgi:uncharacterized protein YndB with AHSA1/START domain